MAGPDAERRALRRLDPLLVGLLLGAGCVGNSDKMVTLPPVSETEKPRPEPRRGEEPVATPKPPTVVVIDEGGVADEARPKSLVEASRAEKDRRAQAQRPVVALDDKSLKEHGKDQKLTVASGSAPAPAASANEPASAEEGGAEVRDEAWWRSRGLEIRQRWRTAHDRVAELQAEAEGLRRRFYSADDPYVRDSQIKPEWDRVLDELDGTRREAERGPEELDRFLQEGREAGALPGWLREGIEFEPEPRPLESPTAEPTEPVEATEPPANPA